MAFVSSSFANKKLQDRRYTNNTVPITGEAFTSVLDINANEVYTDVKYIPTSSAGIPFSGSSQAGYIVSASYTDPTVSPDLPVLKYWYRHKLTPAGTGVDRQAYFFLSTQPATTTTTVGSYTPVQATQVTNFISPKYIGQFNAADTLNDADAASTPGYKVILFKKTSTNPADINRIADKIPETDYVFDYKTGVVSFNTAPATNEYVFATAYQYIGRTLGSQISDGTLGGGASSWSELTGIPSGLLSSSAQIASNISGSLGANASFIRSLTADKVSGSLGPNATFIRALTANKVSGSWQSQYFNTLSAVKISGSLGSNATLIRSLTAAGISGSLGPNATFIRTLTATKVSGSFTRASASFSTRVTTIEGRVNQAVNTTSNVTFAGLNVTGNTTIDGNLTVNGGLTAINSTNINVEDAFVRIASGSASVNVDGGLFIQSGSSANSGSALYHDAGDQRWAVAKHMREADTDLSSKTYISRSFIVTTTAAAGAPDEADVRYGYGEIYINESNGDIYIRTKTP